MRHPYLFKIYIKSLQKQVLDYTRTNHLAGWRVLSMGMIQRGRITWLTVSLRGYKVGKLQFSWKRGALLFGVLFRTEVADFQYKRQYRWRQREGIMFLSLSVVSLFILMKDLPENLPSPHVSQIGCLFIHSFVYLFSPTHVLHVCSCKLGDHLESEYSLSAMKIWDCS